jgi:predicted GNAT family N-acyltransferase
VFILEQGVPRELEWDTRDAEAIHLLAEDAAGNPLATARLLPSGQIGRMAVLTQWRKRGIGSRLLQLLLQITREEQFPTPWLNSQTSALGFYLRAGFAVEGGEFIEAGIPHRRMSWRGHPTPENKGG